MKARRHSISYIGAVIESLLEANREGTRGITNGILHRVATVSNMTLEERVELADIAASAAWEAVVATNAKAKAGATEVSETRTDGYRGFSLGAVLSATLAGTTAAVKAAWEATRPEEVPSTSARTCMRIHRMSFPARYMVSCACSVVACALHQPLIWDVRPQLQASPQRWPLPGMLAVSCVRATEVGHQAGSKRFTIKSHCKACKTGRYLPTYHVDHHGVSHVRWRCWWLFGGRLWRAIRC